MSLKPLRYSHERISIIRVRKPGSERWFLGHDGWRMASAGEVSVETVRGGDQAAGGAGTGWGF